MTTQPANNPTLSIYINFEGNCREAFAFYRSVFGGEFSTVMVFGDMPPSEDMQMPDGWDDKVMHVSYPIGNSILMGSDMPPGFGPPLVVGSNYSVSYAAASRDDADRVFAALSEGGQVTMELQDMFWGDYFGRVDGSIRHQLAGWPGDGERAFLKDARARTAKTR